MKMREFGLMLLDAAMTVMFWETGKFLRRKLDAWLERRKWREWK